MSRVATPPVVAELIADGRGVAARPAFERGLHIAIGPKGRRGARIGDLVTIRARGGGADVIARHGRASSARDAMQALVADAGLWADFSKAVLAEAEEQATAESTEDAGRLDLRAQRVITIDPDGAKDHDDAICVRGEGDAIRLWVHIADVARFVPAGGAIDREAARRGTSNYLPGVVIPMLPPRLSTDVCSLRPGVDRKVVTAEILVGVDGAVTEMRFYRALVHSKQRLTYPQVDAVFAGLPLDDSGLDADLATARDLAERLRRRRMSRGALEVNSSEPSFTFRDGEINGVEMEGQTPAHSLVEECMIAANEAVARYLIDRRRATVFRVHPPPSARSIELCYHRLEALDIPTPPLADGPLTPEQCEAAARAASVAVAAVTATGRGAHAFPGLVLRALQRAYYDVAPPGHSGLASPAYLHFTSPIRRYPDLLAHRTLLDALGIGDPGPDLTELAVEAAESSEREREAQNLERRADRMALAFLLRERLRHDTDEALPAEVTGLVGGGAFLRIEGLYDGFLPVRAVDEDDWNLDEAEVTLIGRNTGIRIALGDALTVVVDYIEPLRGRVTVALAGQPRPTGQRRVPSAGGKKGRQEAPRRRGHRS